MTAHRLVETLEAAGAERAVDVDAALMCQTFDALGLVGFGKDFHAAEDLCGCGARACQAIKDGAARWIRRPRGRGTFWDTPRSRRCVRVCCTRNGGAQTRRKGMMSSLPACGPFSGWRTHALAGRAWRGGSPRPRLTRRPVRAQPPRCWWATS